MCIRNKWTNWDSINWKKVARGVKSLQRRIVKAVKGKHFHKAKALLILLTSSFYGKLLAILSVTSNKGSRTCGVDNVLWNTPARKWKAIEQLSVKGYKAKPLKRKSIPKKNGKLQASWHTYYEGQGYSSHVQIRVGADSRDHGRPELLWLQAKALMCRCY